MNTYKKRQRSHNDNNKNGLTKICALLTYSLIFFAIFLYYNKASFHVDCEYRFHSIFYFVSHDQRY